MYKKISLAVMALITVNAAEKYAPHTDLIDLQTDAVHVKNIQKEINPYGQVSVERKFAYTYDPDVKAAVERQEKQEEAFAVPSVRAINGKGNANNNQLVQKEINPYGQVSVERKFAYTYDPDVKAAVERQEKQEEAFAVPSVRAINGKGNANNNRLGQLRTLPDTTQNAPGVGYDGSKGLVDEPIRESSEIFSSSNGAWGTGKSEIGGDPIVFSQKEINPYGQVSVERKFAYTYDPDVKAAVERQEKQEEAFAVPSVRAINGKGNANNNRLSQMRTLPDTTQNAPGVGYDGSGGLVDEPIRESSGIFSDSNGAWGKDSKIGGDAITFKKQQPHVLFQKEINPYGQVSVERKFAYTYDPDVKAAVERQEKQEEAFAVPSVRAINGKGNANNNQ